MHRISRIVLAASVSLVLLGLAAGSVGATPALREKLRPLAKDIFDLSVRENQPAIAFADIPGDNFSDSNAGPGLQQLLIEELQAEEKNQRIVQKKANLVVRGVYQAVTKVDALGRKLLQVEIDLTVVNAQGKQLLQVKAVVDNSEDIARLVAYTGDLPPNANRGQLNEQIQQRLNKPQFHSVGTKIFSKEGQPFAVELLVKGPTDAVARPREPINVDGQAFVDIGKGEIYELRLHNQAPFEAAITVSIDGLDVFTFSDDRDPKTGRSLFSHYLVPGKGGSATVLGWHKTVDRQRQDNVLSFLVTEYGHGAASQRKAVGKVGTITVTFAAAWRGDDNKPDDESRARGVETGFGPPRQVPFQVAPRTIGVVRDQITVRYERTKAN